MSPLKDRFDKHTKLEQLLDALKRQSLIVGDDRLARTFADTGEVLESQTGDKLIEQGAWDDDFYFILAGSFDVFINGQYRANRAAGVHVGELTGLKADRPRTATLVAKEPSVTLRVSKQVLNDAAGNDPKFWMRVADVVADRLDQRNLQIGKANDFPRVFVISSSEAIDIAREVRANLDSEKIHVHLWDKGTFNVSEYPISDLEDAIEAADFTVSVVRPDDNLIMRKTSMKAARDNVHLEYGLSVGKLGRSRSILLVQAAKDLHLPSDLAGLTTKRYRAGSPDEMKRTVATACDEIREHIDFHNVRQDRFVS